jgi:hypothetical protein
MTTPDYVLFNNRQWINDNVGIYFYGTYADNTVIPKSLADINSLKMIDCGQLNAHTITNNKYLILSYIRSDGSVETTVLDFASLISTYPGTVSSTNPYKLVIRWSDDYSNGTFSSYEMLSINKDVVTYYKAAPVSANPSTYSRVNDIVIATNNGVTMARPASNVLTLISNKRIVVYPKSNMLIVLIILVIIIFIILAVVGGVIFLKKRKPKAN